MKRTPYGHRYKDCEKVLIHLGYKVRQGKGSHVRFSKGKDIITIANHRPIDPKAIKDILRAWES